MSFHIPAPMPRDLASLRRPSFDPATALSGDRIVTEGLEPLDGPSMDVLVDGTAEGWSLLVCSTFDDIQPGTVVFHEQQLSTTFPRPFVGFKNTGWFMYGERQLG